MSTSTRIAPCIALIDDDDSRRYTLSRYLRQAGYQVKEGANGQSALTMAMSRPDLLILDINLPDMMGNDICRILKSNPETASLFILLVSATFNRSQVAQQGFESEADGFLACPVDPEELLIQVKLLLRLRESDRRANARASELQVLYDTAPIGLCQFDRNLRYIRVNNRMAEINGIPAVNHIGRTPRDIVPELAAQAQALAEQIFRTGEPILNVEFEGTTAAQPGMRRYWIANWAPIKNLRGEITGINVTAEEITERKRMEAALFDSEQRMEIALPAAGAGVWEADLDSGKNVWAHGMAGLLGVPAESVKDFENQWSEFILPEDRQAVIAGFEAASKNMGETWEAEFRVKRLDGSIRWLASRGKVVKLANGGRKMIGVAQDVTERKASAANLNNTAQRKPKSRERSVPNNTGRAGVS